MIFRKLTGKLATVSWHVDVSKFCSMQSKMQQESASLLILLVLNQKPSATYLILIPRAESSKASQTWGERQKVRVSADKQPPGSTQWPPAVTREGSSPVSPPSMGMAVFFLWYRNSSCSGFVHIKDSHFPAFFPSEHTSPFCVITIKQRK